jgi:predicted ArsR family transcriptional regulator
VKLASDDASSISALAALDERVRRRLFEFVRHAHRAVSREEAAAATGISRKLAAFHLDRLVEVGLLRARYEPPFGSPRRAGRAPKVYDLADTAVQVSIPHRDYQVLAEIMVEALSSETPRGSARQAALRVALEHGKKLGSVERSMARGQAPGGGHDIDRAEDILSRHGFEPYRQRPDAIRLRNCPFHPLSVHARDLVCGMNHAYLAGLLTGMDAGSMRAFLDPRAGECCVELRTLEPAGS